MSEQKPITKVPDGHTRFYTTRQKAPNEKGFVGYETVWKPFQKEVETRRLPALQVSFGESDSGRKSSLRFSRPSTNYDANHPSQKKKWMVSRRAFAGIHPTSH